jgi:hypothetical protein
MRRSDAVRDDDVTEKAYYKNRAKFEKSKQAQKEAL